jgi:hypothetical protein
MITSIIKGGALKVAASPAFRKPQRLRDLPLFLCSHIAVWQKYPEL